MNNPLKTINTSTAYAVGFVYYTKKMAEAIRKLSGPLTESNEYQVHYNATVFRIGNTEDGIIDICVPTVVFNYPQEVTTSSISFDLKDVTKMTDTVSVLDEPMTKIVTSKFYKKLKDLADRLNTSIEVKSTHFNNIHKHPGSMDCFSGTDYDTNPKDPGIVFPLTSGNMSPIFSSIILHKDETKIAHSEYRLANRVDDTLTYYQGDCYQIVRGYSRKIPSLYKLFSKLDDTVPSDMSSTDIPIVKEVLDILDSIDYEPRTDAIIADNVKKEKLTTYKYQHDWNGYGYSSKNSRYSSKTSKRKVTAHIGRLPSIDTLLDNFHVYKDKIFTTTEGKYLSNDIKEFIEDAVMEYEGVSEEFTHNDINKLLGEYANLDLLDMYIEPYEEDKLETPSFPSMSKSAGYVTPLNKRK